ncbi:MAG: hypothetical protein ABIA92_01370 [Patescibacteria group bacterium]
MNQLKIIKATYYDPMVGSQFGVDVTKELSAEIKEDQLIYIGSYNRIFSNYFKGKRKKLEITVQYKGQTLTKFYNEDEKINLPNDLNKLHKQWINIKNPWLISIVGGTIAAVTGGLILLKITTGS